MPTYDYKVKDKAGKNLKGRMTALDKDKLVEKLKKSGLTVVEINEIVDTRPQRESPQKGRDADKKASMGFSFGVSDDEMAFFTRQFATILNAGVPLDRILSLLHNQSKSQVMRNALYEVGADIQKGLSLSDSFGKHKKIFDNLFLSMITVGETGGSLPNAMNRLAYLLERTLAIKKQIQSAMAYPLFILAFSMVLSYCLVTFMLPGFIPMFTGLGLDIRKDFPLTAILMDLSALARNPAVIISTIIVIVALVVGTKMLIKNVPAFKYFVDAVLLGTPGVGTLVKQSSFARVCRSFGSLAQSGVPVLRALDLVSGAAGNFVISSAIRRISTDVQEGNSLSKALMREKVFPELLVQMVSVGEEAGSVPDMFNKTADYFDQSLDSAVAALTSLLEPAMMIFIGGIVATFVLGILLPLLSITSKMGN